MGISKVFDIIYNVKKKNIENSVDDNKKTIEKEMDAVNVNRNISLKLLAQNFMNLKTFMLGIGATAILTAYELITSGEPAPVEEEETGFEDGLNSELEELNTATNDFTSSIEETPDYFTGLDQSVSILESDTSTALTKTTNSLTSDSENMKEDMNIFMKSVENNNLKTSIVTSISGNEAAYKEGLKNIENIDITKPSIDYAKSVTEAIDSSVSDIDSKLIPSYKVYTEQLSATIDGLNKIFNVQISSNIEREHPIPDVEIDNKGQDTQIPSYAQPQPLYSDPAPYTGATMNAGNPISRPLVKVNSPTYDGVSR